MDALRIDLKLVNTLRARGRDRLFSRSSRKFSICDLRQLPELDLADARHDVQIDVLSILPQWSNARLGRRRSSRRPQHACANISAASLMVGLLLGEMCRPLFMSTLTAA